MAARKDSVLRLETGVVPTKKQIADEVWRAFWLPSSSGPQVAVIDAMRWYPLCTRPETVGWFVRSLDGAGQLVTRLVDDGTILSESVQALSAEPHPVRLPWPAGLRAPPSRATLEIMTTAGKAGVDLLINRVMDRGPLLGLAKGNGIEIGPGPKPQILPSSEIVVRYLEEMPQEKWASNYDNTGKRGTEGADWAGYVIGKAHEIPVDDGTLDFVFMSHVFEHLANPLGHLERWSRKLRRGGAVLVVCPDIAGGSKDYTMRPSTMAEWETEYREGTWSPNAAHIERFAKGRNQSAERLRNDRFSVHVHFYGRENTAALLDRAVELGLYEGWNITHAANNKDFHFICVRGS